MKVSLPPVDHPPLEQENDSGRQLPSHPALWFLLGAIVSGVLVWWMVHPRAEHWAPVDVVHGTTTWTSGYTGGPVHSIWVQATSGHVFTMEGLTAAHGQGYGVDVSGATGSDCLKAGTGGQQVVMGVIHAAPSDAADFATGGDVVVWIECLSPPTRHF